MPRYDTSESIRNGALLTDISAKPAAGVSFVGALLGVAAALVSVRSPILPAYVNISAILVCFAVVTAFAVVPRHRVGSLTVTAVDATFCIYILWRLGAEFYNASTLDVEFATNSLLDILIWALAYLAVRVVLVRSSDVWTLLRWLAAPALFVSLLAVMQLINVPGINQFLLDHVNSGGLETRIARGWDLRGTSTIGHWTALGGYLSAAVAITCARIINMRRKGDRISPWTLTLLVVLVFGQVSTLTFATIGLTAVIVLVTAYRLRLGMHIVSLGVAVVALAWVVAGVALGDRLNKQLSTIEAANSNPYWWLPESIGFRVNVWVTETVPAIVERPMTGWGISAYRYLGTGLTSERLQWISPESEWLRTGVTAGATGLILQLALVGAVAHTVWRSRQELPGFVFDPIFVFFVGLFVVCFVHSHLTNRGVPLMLWPIVACTLAIRFADGEAATSPGAARVLTNAQWRGFS